MCACGGVHLGWLAVLDEQLLLGSTEAAHRERPTIDDDIFWLQQAATATYVYDGAKSPADRKCLGFCLLLWG
jgi:hypothetical protein